MREIKFRALAHHNNGDKEWFYYTPKTGKIITDMYVNNKIRRWVVEDLQYVGQKDKTGKEIYSGDIVKGEYREYKIERLDDCFGYKLMTTDGSTPTRIPLYENSNKIEIIGNIYENPDLLNKIDLGTKNT